MRSPRQRAKWLHCYPVSRHLSYRWLASKFSGKTAIQLHFLKFVATEFWLRNCVSSFPTTAWQPLHTGKPTGLFPFFTGKTTDNGNNQSLNFHPVLLIHVVSVAPTLLRQLRQLCCVSCANYVASVASTMLRQLRQLCCVSCANYVASVAPTMLRQLRQLCCVCCANYVASCIIILAFLIQQFICLSKGSEKTKTCRLAEWVAFLHAVVIATVVMCRVRNPACTARERYINGRSIEKPSHPTRIQKALKMSAKYKYKIKKFLGLQATFFVEFIKKNKKKKKTQKLNENCTPSNSILVIVFFSTCLLAQRSTRVLVKYYNPNPRPLRTSQLSDPLP